MRRPRTILALGGVLALSLALALPAAATGGRPLTAAPLLGANETPTLGDPDASGSAWFSFNPGLEKVCYAFEVSGADPLAAAHIHRAPAGAPGPVVIPTPPTSATGGSGCVHADRELILEILMDPSAFYFNVHNAAFQGGAARAQLSK